MMMEPSLIDYDFEDRLHDRIAIRQIAARLDRRSRRVLRAWNQGSTDEETGRVEGVTKNRINVIRRAAVQRLQREAARPQPYEFDRVAFERHMQAERMRADAAAEIAREKAIQIENAALFEREVEQFRGLIEEEKAETTDAVTPLLAELDAAAKSWPKLPQTAYTSEQLWAIAKQPPKEKLGSYWTIPMQPAADRMDRIRALLTKPYFMRSIQEKLLLASDLEAEFGERGAGKLYATTDIAGMSEQEFMLAKYDYLMDNLILLEERWGAVSPRWMQRDI